MTEDRAALLDDIEYYKRRILQADNALLDGRCVDSVLLVRAQADRRRMLDAYYRDLALGDAEGMAEINFGGGERVGY